MSCIWSTYGRKCGEEFVNAEGFCATHANKTCRNCGLEATEGCNYCGQFVCGAPMCKDCGACCESHGAKKERVKPFNVKKTYCHYTKDQLIELLELSDLKKYERDVEEFHKALEEKRLMKETVQAVESTYTDFKEKE